VILAVETSCDDTCAALVTADGHIQANVISSQGVHDRYGGVVPEVAARHHLELVDTVIADALRRAEATFDDVSLVAATRGPGLIGALLVGLAAAKGVAAARRLPFAAVDHLRGHVAAAFLEPDPLEVPFVSLIASGGHTLLLRVETRDGEPEILARTLDDAAGEAFDKGARLLGLGYPGGPALERLASRGDPGAYAFPTGRGEDFSFAGLKTALLYKVRELEPLDEEERADLAASFQEAIVTALVDRARRALARSGLERLAVGGGVAANGVLRARLGELDVELSIPPAELCTDNAAMIASAARYVEPLDYPDYFAIDAYASGEGPFR
jgi:N6-L-threonylcarbamoyladenine synthase